MAENEEKTGVRDFDPTDFDSEGNLTNKELEQFYDDERQKMLGAPVSGFKQNYVEAPPVVEKADASDKAVILRGDSADVLASKYSQKQLTDLADTMGVTYKANTGKLALAIDLQKKWNDDNPSDSDGQNSLNVLPASPETHTEAEDNSGDETSRADPFATKTP